MAKKTCSHADAFVVYPGELTVDSAGNVREDSMRLYCEACGNVSNVN